MTIRFAMAVLLLVVAGCGPGPVKAPDEPSPAAREEAAQAPPAPKPRLGPRIGIGDIEAYVKIEGVLDPASESERIEVEEMRNPKRTLTLTTLRVAAPHPDELWLNFGLRCQQSFAERPVAIRGTILRQNGREPEEEIGSFNTVAGRYAGRFEAGEGVLVPQLEFEFDVLTGLSAAPDTMLVHARVEVLLMPEGTDEAAIDPKTATAAPMDRAILMSNPVRIDFE